MDLWVNIVRPSARKSSTTNFEDYSPPFRVRQWFRLHVAHLSNGAGCCCCTPANTVAQSKKYDFMIASNSWYSQTNEKWCINSIYVPNRYSIASKLEWQIQIIFFQNRLGQLHDQFSSEKLLTSLAAKISLNNQRASN